MIETSLRYAVGSIEQITAGEADHYGSTIRHLSSITSKLQNETQVIGIYQYPVYDAENYPAEIAHPEGITLLNSLFCISHHPDNSNKVKEYISLVDDLQRVKLINHQDFLKTDFSKKMLWNLEDNPILKDSIQTSLKWSLKDYGLTRNETEFLNN